MKSRFVVLSILLLCSVSVRAAIFDAYLKIEGVEGEAVAAGYEKQIDVYSFSWGMSQTSTTGGTGKVAMQDFHFRKRIDKSSPLLMLRCASGQHIPEAVFVFRKAGADKPATYYKVTLQDVLVSSYSTGGSNGDDLPMESVSFNFTKVIIEYFPDSPTGGTTQPVRFGWDLATNTRL